MNASGFAVIGTPDDVAAQIQRLIDQSGGFGTFLCMGHEWADRAATHRSYSLLAREVFPRFQGSRPHHDRVAGLGGRAPARRSSGRPAPRSCRRSSSTTRRRRPAPTDTTHVRPARGGYRAPVGVEGRRYTGIAALACGLLFLGLALWAPGPVTVTADEPNWLVRSDAFRAAIAEGDLRDANGRVLISAPEQTSPGVTTMWSGTIGHGVVELGQRIGVIEERPPGTRNDQLRLRAGRGVVSVLCAVALVVFVLYAARLVGRGAALVAGVLLATEPFLVGHAGVLHTDALVTLWSAAAVVAYLVALTTRPRDRVVTAVAAVERGARRA